MTSVNRVRKDAYSGVVGSAVATWDCPVVIDRPFEIEFDLAQTGQNGSGLLLRLNGATATGWMGYSGVMDQAPGSFLGQGTVLQIPSLGTIRPDQDTMHVRLRFDNVASTDAMKTIEGWFRSNASGANYGGTWHAILTVAADLTSVGFAAATTGSIGATSRYRLRYLPDTA